MLNFVRYCQIITKIKKPIDKTIKLGYISLTNAYINVIICLLQTKTNKPKII